MLAPGPRTAAAQATVAAPAGARRRLLASIATAGLWAALLWFHAHLLWQRITDLTLFEPVVALRWGATVVILVALARLRRLGVPLFRGRRALILWLVVLLLHAGSVAAVGSRLEIVAEAGAVAEAGLLIAASLWLLALAGGFGKRSAGSDLVRRRAWPPRPAPAALPCAPGSLDPLSPRPPPLA
jgi:hypothetical protein